jgi:two-component system response regulator HupR/HoxA
MTQSPKPRVFFVDDEQDLAASLADKYSNRYETMAFTSPHEVLHCIDESVAVVVADHRMPGMTGVELLGKLRIKSPETVRILLTAVADMIPLLELINDAKVFHYIPKGPLFPEHMKGVLADAVELYTLRQESKRNLRSLKQQNVQLKAQLRVHTSEETSFEDLLGSDPQLQNAIRLGKWAATHDRPVLITGESGTGKDVLARAIHCKSQRKDHAFRAVNCAWLRPELAQAALFGKVKGAYTGATEADKGILRQTDGGTLFLNEIGELSQDVQAFFLTFLDRGDIEPVGYSGSENLKANVRIIAATNRNIVSQAHAANGTFRLDLFNRLNGTSIRLPALRDRLSDIPILARPAVIVASSKLGLDNMAISDEAIAYLQTLPYPGNVRELINTVEQAMDSMQMSGAAQLELEHVRAARWQQPRPLIECGSLAQAVDAFTKQFVEAALKRHKYKQVASAGELGISDRYLRDLIKKFEIAKEE